MSNNKEIQLFIEYANRYPGQPVCYEFNLGSGRSILYKRSVNGKISTCFADDDKNLGHFYDGYLNLNKRITFSRPYPLYR